VNVIISPLVVGECQPTCAAELFRLQQQGSLRFVDPEHISSELYLELLAAHELGEGETECLTLCLSHPYILCCDDRKARQIGANLLGQPRVIGSIRLLKWCVVENLTSAAKAFEICSQMKVRGGFLPEVKGEWFAESEA
jgi:predicted nucleic acid-binding protein